MAGSIVATALARPLLLAATTALASCCCCPTCSPGRMPGQRVTLPSPPRPSFPLPDWEPAPRPPPPVPAAPQTPVFQPYPQVAPPVAPPPTPTWPAPTTMTQGPSPRRDLSLSWSLDDDQRASIRITNGGNASHPIVLPRGGSVEHAREPYLQWTVYVLLANGQAELEGPRERGAFRDEVDWAWQDDVVTVEPGRTVELPAILPTAGYEISPSDRVRIELTYWFGQVGPERSGRTDRGGMEGVERFVLRAPAITMSAREWFAAIERHRRSAPRSPTPAHFALHADGCVELYIDGTLRGRAPIELDLAPGNYTRALRACGSRGARVGPLVVAPNDRVVERMSAADVAALSAP